ncbi:MAG: hypothetical protein E6K18_06410 [Methanobacteriota archaeon]|nr:MAG: hypothetical protein E6K18_06410 [Euryarchaeota archaeon]
MTRKETAAEIAVRLGVRRKFYRLGFVFFVIMLALPMAVFGWGSPIEWQFTAAIVVFPALGTGAVFWWAYVVSRAALYEEVGRRFIGKE